MFVKIRFRFRLRKKKVPMATKPREQGPGVKASVDGPLIKELFCGFPNVAGQYEKKSSKIGERGPAVNP